jgi:hypothetical protein
MTHGHPPYEIRVPPCDSPTGKLAHDLVFPECFLTARGRLLAKRKTPPMPARANVRRRAENFSAPSAGQRVATPAVGRRTCPRPRRPQHASYSPTSRRRTRAEALRESLRARHPKDVPARRILARYIAASASRRMSSTGRSSSADSSVTPMLTLTFRSLPPN